MGFPEKGRREYRPAGDKRRKFSDDGDTEKTLTKVTCDECGKSCMVPFRPTAGKPVYCNDCFREKGDSRGERSFAPKRSHGSDTRNRYQSDRSSSSSSSHDLAQINSKLDKILELLER